MKPLTFTLAVTLVALSLTAASQQPAASTSPVYNVEIVVFRATGAQGTSENWGGTASTTPLDASGESDAPAPGATGTGRFVGVLPESSYQLTELAAKLRSSGVYVPVAHVAWSQTASPWGSRAGFPIERLGIEAAGLSGTVFLERGQYLHLGMALNYAPANPPSGLGASPGTTFTLTGSRRVRFYERNYYDHPAFGVIALITPAQGARPPGR